MRQLPRPNTRLELRRTLDRAWERYVRDGVEPVGVGDEIVRSWRRSSREYGIDPALRVPTRRLTADQLHRRREGDEALRLARPILSDFSRRLGLADHVLTYFDADGWMLAIEGTPVVVEGVSAIDFRPGVCWAEDAAGTNGPGTALAEGRPVEVFAAEHYVTAWQPWSCAAAPVLAPGSSSPVGVVDITSPWEVQRCQALVAAQAIARAIEERLRAAVTVREEVVSYAFRAARASGDALVAVDSRGAVKAVNDAATRIRVVEAGALPLQVRKALLSAFSGHAAAVGTELRIEIPDVPALVASPVTHEGVVVGAILRAPAGRAPQRAARGRAGQGARPSPGARLARYDFARILGGSASLARAVELARVAARNSLPVALLGESGTGKELFAHAIHAASPRSAGPFVVVNCGSIPGQLVEAELFGYEAGAFTGGRSDGNPGRFEDADGGTLFLDEVSELSGQAQTALLRVLQEKEVVRLGSSAPRPVDVRIVAASNKPLEAEIEAHRFRRDLFYRLHVLAIDIPPLRERGDDIALLAQAILAEAEEAVGRSGLSFSRQALEALHDHRWPGNVRELKNVILRAAAVALATEIQAADLALAAAAGPAGARSRGPDAPGDASLRDALIERERGVLLEAVNTTGWNLSRAAARLGISRMTLYRRLARCSIPLSRPAGGTH